LLNNVEVAVSVPFEVKRQYYVPQHALSWFAGKLARCRIKWFKNWAIRRFVRLYNVNLSEAEQPNIERYECFHDFFIRKLAVNTRLFDSHPNSFCSPCDGSISQIGSIDQDTLVQAKGKFFTLEALLGNKANASLFHRGKFATLYLAPKDYHRVHMPYEGVLQQLRYIPGKLFSVNTLTTEHVDQLFAQNERVVAIFQTERGKFAVIMVGAMIVGSIFTRWSGHLSPHRGKKIIQVDFPVHQSQQIALDKGEEMGYFSLGSTVILLGSENLSWEHTLKSGETICLGQKLGHLL